MSANGKDTIYVDIDDEITGIIDKVRNSPEKIVALVLPKRATVFQSIVNMKLLQRSADSAKKHIVLITSEAGLMPLAASVGLYVAKTLQTKPAIPEVAAVDDDDESDVPVTMDDADEEINAKNAGNRPVGELAGKTAAPAAMASEDEVETMELGDEPEDETSSATAEAAKTTKKGKNKKIHIPNFDKFRLRLVLGVLVLILLFVGLFVANTVLPKASITVSTNTSTVNSNLTLTLDSTAKTLDLAQLTVPAQVQQAQKNYSQQVPTTGQKNEGQKATGTVTVSTQCTKKPSPISQGIGVSSGGLTFITTDTLTFGNIGFDGNGNVVCSGSVPVIAQQGGSQYNLPASSTFTVAGYPGMSGSNSNAFTGGTDNIIKVVAQADIDGATQKISSQDTSAIKQQLQQQLQQAGLYAITATLNAGTPTTTTSANVGDQADNVTVTEAVTYTMLGVKQSDLKAVIDNDVKSQIDSSKQTILDEGLANATFRVITSSGTGAQVAISTVSTAGSDLNVASLKQQVAGKKSGDVVSLIKANPGVTDVKVQLSPFWVNVVPKKLNKITITFNKTVTQVKSNPNASTP